MELCGEGSESSTMYWKRTLDIFKTLVSVTKSAWGRQWLLDVPFLIGYCMDIIIVVIHSDKIKN